MLKNFNISGLHSFFTFDSFNISGLHFFFAFDNFNILWLKHFCPDVLYYGEVDFSLSLPLSFSRHIPLIFSYTLVVHGYSILLAALSRSFPQSDDQRETLEDREKFGHLPRLLIVRFLYQTSTSDQLSTYFYLDDLRINCHVVYFMSKRITVSNIYFILWTYLWPALIFNSFPFLRFPLDVVFDRFFLN